jgi:hypothetical protein
VQFAQLAALRVTRRRREHRALVTLAHGHSESEHVKAVFGILALVVVLAVVASLAKTQLHTVGGGASAGRNAAAAAGALPGAVAADPNATVPQQSRALQERARAETARALEQGADRNRRADP